MLGHKSCCHELLNNFFFFFLNDPEVIWFSLRLFTDSVRIKLTAPLWRKAWREVRGVWGWDLFGSVDVLLDAVFQQIPAMCSDTATRCGQTGLWTLHEAGNEKCLPFFFRARLTKTDNECNVKQHTSVSECQWPKPPSTADCLTVWR